MLLIYEISKLLLDPFISCSRWYGIRMIGCRTLATNKGQTAYISILFHPGNVESLSSACVIIRLREWNKKNVLHVLCMHISTITSTCAIAAVFGSHPDSSKKVRLAFLHKNFSLISTAITITRIAKLHCLSETGYHVVGR